jgi:hypothetical protein
MEVEFDLDGSISAELAVRIARAAFDRNHKDEPFLPPLAKLLLIANDPAHDVSSTNVSRRWTASNSIPGVTIRFADGRKLYHRRKLQAPQ